MARVKDLRDMKAKCLMAFDFSSGAEIAAFIANNRLEESFRKSYYQDGHTIIVGSDNVNDVMEAYHNVKDHIKCRVSSRKYDMLRVPDH